jgi:hypothetical protein
VSTNLGVIKRVCELKGLRRVQFHVLHMVEDLDRLETDYDAVFGFGSLMNAPESVMKPEFDALVRRLKPHGRFIMHAYPKVRWEREGRVPFDRWGEQTDGPGTPWAEWYDTRKLQRLLLPARFEPVLYCEYYKGAMNCIDLLNVTGDPQFEERPLPASAILLEGATGLGSLCVYDYWPGAALQNDHAVTTLTTAPGTWSYSAEIQIDRSRVPAGSPLFLQLTLQVCEGEIGVGALDPDGTRFVVERQFEPQGAFATVLLEIPSLREIGLVIIRNTRRDGLPSIASFQSIAVYGQGAPQTVPR